MGHYLEHEIMAQRMDKPRGAYHPSTTTLYRVLTAVGECGLQFPERRTMQMRNNLLMAFVAGIDPGRPLLVRIITLALRVFDG